MRAMMRRAAMGHLVEIAPTLPAQAAGNAGAWVTDYALGGTFAVTRANDSSPDR